MSRDVLIMQMNEGLFNYYKTNTRFIFPTLKFFPHKNVVSKNSLFQNEEISNGYE